VPVLFGFGVLPLVLLGWLGLPAGPLPVAATARQAAEPLPALPAVAAVPAVNRAGSQETAAAAFRSVAGLSPRALAAALDAVACARARGVTGRDEVLTLIDYSLPSTAPRLWVLDLARGRVLFHELVAHGAGSGDNYATRFSNTAESRQSSLGLFLTGSTYEGGNGYSLRLNGLEPGVNDRAEERKIVMHGAWYVSADHAQQFGRLGRSWGCPALPVASAHAVIDAVKEGTFLFSYAGGSASSRASRAAYRTACQAAPPLSAARALPAAQTAPASTAPLAPLAPVTAGTH
jgi:hypothetical protein